MSIRKITFVPGEYYHLFNRGNSKQKIFKNSDDYLRFIKLLYISNSEQSFKFRDMKDVYSKPRINQQVSIGAYCLMPNHFHILLAEKENGNISKFMQKLQTAYSMYFNIKYKRSGGLFEGKFKSEHLSSDIYLKYIFSYIHLNPLKIMDSKWKENRRFNKQSAIHFLNKYYFSSYRDYRGEKRIENILIDRNDFPDYFPTTKTFNNEIFDWITLNK